MNYQKAKENSLKYWECAQIATSKKRYILCQFSCFVLAMISYVQGA